jgi:hypothetical protein
MKSYTTTDLVKLLTEADPAGKKQLYMNDGDGNGDVPCGIVIDWQSDECLCLSIADIDSSTVTDIHSES